MPRLLVSVVDAAEARIALDAGADLVDVKDPRKGSLGAPDAATVASVVAEVAGAVPVSVALGELRHLRRLSGMEQFPSTAYAKLGMAGCAVLEDWPTRWAGALKRLPPGVKPVAVAYADWSTAGAPEPTRVIVEATQLGCAAVLVDTYDKSHGNLTSHWKLGEIAQFTSVVQRLGMMAVLAGSVTIDIVASLAALGPDYIAVRGAVCDGGREGPIRGQRVARLVDVLARRSDVVGPPAIA
jgi:(5-formylfuran-3-yl)methyl phosphate synthase